MSNITSQAVLRGLRGKCPNCGQGRILQGYLKTVPNCANCGVQLGHLRADDMPPWFTIIITGHLMAPMIMAVNRHTEMSSNQQIALWVPLAMLLVYLLLPRAKGVTLALLWGIQQPSPEQDKKP